MGATLTETSIEIHREALQEMLSAMRRVIETGPNVKPQLACVRLFTGSEGSGLTVQATSLEIWLRLTTPQVDVSGPFDVLVNAARLDQAINSISDPTVRLSQDGPGVMRVSGSRVSHKIFLLDATGLPPFPEPPTAEAVRVDGSALAGLVGRVSYAASRENSRYAVSGVMVETQGKRLVSVATDGHRLAYDSIASPGELPRCLLPSKAIKTMRPLIAEADAVEVRTDGDKIDITLDDGSRLVASLIEGNFPPYKDVIPKSPNRVARVGRSELIVAMTAAKVMTNEESKGVRLDCSPDGLRITSRAPEMGESSAEVDVQQYSGEPLLIGVNPAYMLEALRATDADAVEIRMIAANKPLIIVADHYGCVVMPLRLE